MSNHFTVTYATFMTCCFCLCCGHGQVLENSVNSSLHSHGTFPTEQNVSRAITNGMHRARILEMFGEPFREDRMQDGSTTALYKIAESNSPEAYEHRFSGFEIVYQNDVVTSWQPIYSSKYLPGSVIRQQSSSNSLPSQSRSSTTDSVVEVSFYVVHESASNGGVYIDTPDLPHLGYISDTPNLVVRHLQSVEIAVNRTSVNNQQVEHPAIILELDKEDARAMQKLSTEHIGAKILIMVDHTPIAAPFVRAPIDSGKVEIAGLDRKKVNILKKELGKLAK